MIQQRLHVAHGWILQVRLLLSMGRRSRICIFHSQLDTTISIFRILTRIAADLTKATAKATLFSGSEEEAEVIYMSFSTRYHDLNLSNINPNSFRPYQAYC